MWVRHRRAGEFHRSGDPLGRARHRTRRDGGRITRSGHYRHQRDRIGAEQRAHAHGGIILTADHDLINTLGKSTGFGTAGLQRNDDGSSSAIDITPIFGSQGLNFFGHQYTSLYINNNGNITFAAASSQFTPDAINAGVDNPIIAPFWADVNTRGRPGTATLGGNSTGSNLVTRVSTPPTTCSPSRGMMSDTTLSTRICLMRSTPADQPWQRRFRYRLSVREHQLDHG